MFTWVVMDLDNSTHYGPWGLPGRWLIWKSQPSHSVPMHQGKPAIRFPVCCSWNLLDAMKNNLASQTWLADLRGLLLKKSYGGPEEVVAWMEGEIIVSGKYSCFCQSYSSSNPTYMINCFKLPILCEEWNGLMSNFWWGRKRDGRRIHWVRWVNFSIPKGGWYGFSGLSGLHYGTFS